jgi:hypothetical protein
MNLDSEWVPMKWPCGPLELALRGKPNTAASELQQTLDAWTQPASLDLLKGTPINCLVVEWANGGPQDAAQQQALRPLVEAGKQRGIAFVGKIGPKAEVAAAANSARDTGLSAVMLAQPASQSLSLPVIIQFARDKVAWESASDIIVATDNEWPGPKLDTMKGDTAVAGPTGVPWVNSNAWICLLSRELAPRKTLWLDLDPPPESNGAHPADYALAVADSEVYGSRWIISLDDSLRAALLKSDSKATSVWNKACQTLAFFAEHREWAGFQPQGVLAVVSDFSGDNAFLSDEVLNLLNRRQVQFQVMERSKALSTPAPHLKGILWLDKDAPKADQLAKLLAFVRQGGLLIASAYWGPAGVTPTPRDPSIDYKMYNLGQGQIAVPNDGFADPYQVALDTHLLVSRRHDLVRLFNPAMTNCHASFDPVHGRQLLQVLNYASSPASFITLWTNSRARQAEFYSPETRQAQPLPGKPAAPGTEFDLPTITVSCALELGSPPAAGSVNPVKP